MQLGTQRTQSTFLPWPHMAPPPLFKNALILLRVVRLKTLPSLSIYCIWVCLKLWGPKIYRFPTCVHVSSFIISRGVWEENMILGHPPYTLENERQELQNGGLEDNIPFQLGDDKIQTVPLGHEKFLLLQEVTQTKGKWNSIQNLCYTGTTSVFEPNINLI